MSPGDAELARQYQVKWPDAEMERIGRKVWTDYTNCISDHNARLARWAEYYRRWRARSAEPGLGDEDISNLAVPYIRWEVLAKLAKEMDALFGDDAQIVAVPVGPSDYRRDKKIGRYMDWRIFSAMKLLNPFCEFITRKLLFGRSVAYSGWKVETFMSRGKQKIKYRGPEFVPLRPDDVIVPVEAVSSIQEFSFVIRRVRVTPDILLAGEERGTYQGITANWEKIVRAAMQGSDRSRSGDEAILQEQDSIEGLDYNNPQSRGESLIMLEWYGKWRALKGKADAPEVDFKRRDKRKKDFVVRYIPDLQLVVGVQDLEQIYPDSSTRRPFVESSMIKDGTYWSPGLGEMLIDLEDELTVNHNLTTDAQQLAASPPVGYRPGSGQDGATFKLRPGMMIPVDDPSRDLRELRIGADISGATWKEQAVLSYGEKLTGMSDMQLGRQPDRPNAPKTGRQTIALLEEGNVRISLDTKVLREDMSGVLRHIWDLECQFTSEDTFFRVTEEDADGVFPVDADKGGAYMIEADFDGSYDFSMKFASSLYSRENDKQLALAQYQLDLQNPLVMQNPRALWESTKRAHKALGDPNFGDMVPEPPAPDISINPREEWTRIQQGEDVQVNPLDNDQLHLIRHHADHQRALENPDAKPDAIKALVAHYRAHIMQLQQKKLHQAIVEQAVAAGMKLAEASGLDLSGGLFGGSISQPPGNPAASDPEIYSGHPENLHGAV